MVAIIRLRYREWFARPACAENGAEVDARHVDDFEVITKDGEEFWCEKKGLRTVCMPRLLANEINCGNSATGSDGFNTSLAFTMEQ